MATMRNRARAKESQQIDEIQRQIGALSDASTQRHRLARGTPAYAAALEAEELIADRVWQLGSALRAEDEPRAERADRPKPDT